MAIDLRGKVSDEDKSRVNDKRNPPDIDIGDSDDDMGGMFNFDDLGGESFGGTGDAGGGAAGFDNIFGDSGSDAPNIFSSPGSDPFSQPGAIGTGLDSSGLGGLQLGNGFGNPLQGAQPNQQTPKEVPKDNMDKLLEYSGDAVNSLGHILMELVKSVKNRTNDDFAQLSTELITVGGFVAGAGLVSSIIGAITRVAILSFFGLGKTLFLSGALAAGTGLCGMGFAAIMIVRSMDDASAGVDSLPDVSSQIEDDNTEEYEEVVGNVLDELMETGFDFDMGDSDDLELDDSAFDMTEELSEPDIDLPSFNGPIKIDFKEQVENVPENRILTRQVLVDTMINFFPLNTPEFVTRREIPEGSDEFNTLETICLKAIANVQRCEVEEVKSQLSSAYETYFSYELKMKRVKGLNKTTELEKELEIYLRDTAEDTSVIATVNIEQDFYKAIITKGVTAVVTMGDAFKQPYVRDFFLDEKNKLPMMTGISELGEVILDDAKVFDTMLIAGKPRSGKSWYVVSVLGSLMFFNTPEDVQMIIIDPKKSTLFKTLALMPHVAGLHSEEGILEIMDDIINNEAPRRKKILLDNRCDDIWAVRKKGIKIPILYLVIDEYITVRGSLGELSKELDSKLQTIISQLPSLGVRILIVPHRAIGVVDKTNRSLISFACSVKGNIEDINDTLGIKKWVRSLVNPGDIAIKTGTREEAFYIRGTALTTSDEENNELIISIAKAFYKMGVDLPDMSSMTVAVNRDDDYIREQLEGDGSRVQYNADNILEGLD